MLSQAEKNFTQADISARVRALHGDLQDMRAVASGSVDNAISMYNPLSFVDRPELAVGELRRVLRPGGRLLIMGQGYPNAIASKINNFLCARPELEALVHTAQVQWNSAVPPLHVFSHETLTELLTAQGFRMIACYGVPIFVQPGPEDFDPENVAQSRISARMKEDADFFEAVFAAEMRWNGDPAYANRGMNLFAVAEKV